MVPETSPPLPKGGGEMEAFKWNRSSCEQQAGAAGEHTEEGVWQSEVSQNNGKGARSFTSEIVCI